jgi:hypothetical protein
MSMDNDQAAGRALRERLEDALAIELESLGITGEVSARACIYLADAAIAVLGDPSIAKYQPRGA